MAVITLSRESGSKGNEVATLLCEKLGYQLFDKPMMLVLAQELENEDERPSQKPESGSKTLSLLERILNPFKDTIQKSGNYYKEIPIEEGRPMTVSQVTNLVLAAYERGNVVIVGRGSQIILADKPDVLRVRLVAPLETRIRTWQERESLSYKDASRKTIERDKAHVDFVKNFFDTDIRDSELYDLVINTEKIPPDYAADLIIQALWHIQPPS